MSQLSLFRGDNKSYTLTFIDGDGAAIDITDWTIFFTVKKNKLAVDADADISKDITSHTAPLTGLSAITLTASDTDLDPRVYWYDIQVKKDDGKIATVMKGQFVVKGDITRRTS